jgi:hypothetical protein
MFRQNASELVEAVVRDLDLPTSHAGIFVGETLRRTRHAAKDQDVVS